MSFLFFSVLHINVTLSQLFPFSLYFCLSITARLRHRETNLEAQLEEISVSQEDQIAELADQLCVIAEEIEVLEKQKSELPPEKQTTKEAEGGEDNNSGRVTAENVKEIYAALVSVCVGIV